MEKRKRKLNIKKLLIFLLVLYLIGSFIFLLLNYSIKNIYIKDNNYLSDQEIIDLAGIRNYPSLIFTSKGSISNKLKKNLLIKSVEINKNIFGKVTITIKEYKPLFYDNNTKQTILSSGKGIDDKLNIPILTNTMPKEIYDKLIISLDKVEEDVMLKISEIEYAQTEQDTERFLIKTTDKIKIYLNIRKFDDINYYNELLATIDGKTGTWHLDYGNYFVSD